MFDFSSSPLESETPAIVSAPCELGCYDGTGTRRMLNFRVRVFNLGDADAILATPHTSGTRTDCGTYLEGALRYELRDTSGNLVRDVDARFRPGCGGYDETSGRFSCELLGLEHGRYNQDSAACPGLDVSGVPAGEYVLSASLELDPVRFADSDPANNRVEAPVYLTAGDPTQPCPDDLNPLLGSDIIDRDCGWTAQPAVECRPGELLAVGCPSCEGAPVLRLCDGDRPCSWSSSLNFLSPGLPGRSDDANSCPLHPVTCPDSGHYMALTTASSPGESYSCEAVPVDVAWDPLEDCTDLVFITSTARECEWAVADTVACEPGTELVVGCPACTGDPMLRVCDGNEPCLDSSAARLGSFDDSTNRGAHDICPLVDFTCPPSGSYTAMAAPVYSDSPFSCNPEPLAIEVDASAPCSEVVAPGYGAERRCDWNRALQGSCSSGEPVTLGCTDCIGTPVLRVCDGSSVCTPGSPAQLAGKTGRPDDCPNVQFECPPSGAYSAWVAASAPGFTAVCMPRVSP